MITVSIVSHNHGSMLLNIVNTILKYKEVKRIVITLNVNESIPDSLKTNKIIKIIVNEKIKGFGSNHNFAFQFCETEFFCVLNPDIIFLRNIFPSLLIFFSDLKVALVAPKIIDSSGSIQDSMRKKIRIKSLFFRFFGFKIDTYFFDNSNFIEPYWVAGMFMLFRSKIYAKINGFDEKYFMYCEDIDICDKLHFLNYKIVGSLDNVAIHDARRASHKNFNHFAWHLRSFFYYFNKKFM